MLIEKILAVAEYNLNSRKIKDVIIGLSLLAVELDDGSIGSSYVLREELEGGCSLLPYYELRGKAASDIAIWAVTGKNALQKALGLCVLNAACDEKIAEKAQKEDAVFAVEIKPEDCIGIIGFIGPVVSECRKKASRIHVFDRGKTSPDILPPEEQKNILPQCDLVFISGTSFINDSIDELLSYCHQARDVLIVGASTPMYPEAFLGTPVTVLAGTLWKKEAKEMIFRKIGMACGIPDLTEYMNKLSLKLF